MGTRCLVTGVTGYIGGRLVPRLLEAGFDVRCLARDPNKLRDAPWRDQVEVARGDVTDASDVIQALADVEVAYYLVHSLGAVGFEETDRRAATVFAGAARDAGVARLVYLGGLEPADQTVSPHLRSRREVGEILASTGVDTVVLRAAIILGSGSASFEMLRYLTERLPVMVTPRWVRNRVQPIAVRDVLQHLVAAASAGPEAAGGWDIGGPDVLTYGELMQRYADVAGLRPRVVVPVPLLTPRLSSYWVNLVTPVPGRLARPLVESLRHEMVCTGPPPPWSSDAEAPIGVDSALRLALQRVRDAAVETRWSSAQWSGAPSDSLPSDPSWAGGSLYVDDRTVEVAAPAQQLWQVIESVGGENGWYSYPLLWALRGHLDRIVGGVGLTRGRRDPRRLAVGDSLDWWRVEELDRADLLRLRAEMRVPGRAWLEMRVESTGPASSVYRQRAVFYPRGLAGHAYWWSVAPFHGLVFGGMLRNIKAAAEHGVPQTSPVR
ncbi:MAG TPA: SDR family oxidoreductase [Mycobacteriales bacterium]|nr:SDR family oxidoreductase [Mycobacteriales bacterium]